MSKVNDGLPIEPCELIALDASNTLHVKVFIDWEVDGRSLPGKFLVPDPEVRKELHVLLRERSGSTQSIPRIHWLFCHSFDVMVQGAANPIRRRDIQKFVLKQVYCQGTLAGISLGSNR